MCKLTTLDILPYPDWYIFPFLSFFIFFYLFWRASCCVVVSNTLLSPDYNNYDDDRNIDFFYVCRICREDIRLYSGAMMDSKLEISTFFPVFSIFLLRFFRFSIRYGLPISMF